MDRYTYTPNLLLNKRLTPPLSPSGRNPSLHPRIISHISRYTKERKREREEEREGREERTERRTRRSGRGKNVWGHSSVLVGGQGVGGEPCVTKQRSEDHMQSHTPSKKTNTHARAHTHAHTHLRRHTHAKRRVRKRTCQMKTCKNWVCLNQRHPNTEWQSLYHTLFSFTRMHARMHTHTHTHTHTKDNPNSTCRHV